MKTDEKPVVSFNESGTWKNFRILDSSSSIEQFVRESYEVNPIISEKIGRSLDNNESFKEEGLTVALSIVRTQDRRSVSPYAEIRLNPIYSNLLRNGSPRAKRYFREICGDGFVDSVLRGRSLHFFLHIAKENHSLETIREVAQEVEDSFFDADNDKRSQKLKAFQGKYKFSLYSYVTGVSSLNTINLNNLYQQYVRHLSC